MELTEKDMCVKGWNWGTAKFSGKRKCKYKLTHMNLDQQASVQPDQTLSLTVFVVYLLFMSNKALKTKSSVNISSYQCQISLFKKKSSLKLPLPALSLSVGPLLSFDVNDNTAFEIPLSNVSQCATGKNEVTLEFHQNDDTEVSLMEVRFYVPPSQSDERQDPVEVTDHCLLLSSLSFLCF